MTTRIVLGTVLAVLIVLVIILVIFRKRIWYKMSRNTQKLLLSIYHRIFWNMIIRAMIEMLYPIML